VDNGRLKAEAADSCCQRRNYCLPRVGPSAEPRKKTSRAADEVRNCKLSQAGCSRAERLGTSGKATEAAGTIREGSPEGNTDPATKKKKNLARRK